MVKLLMVVVGVREHRLDEGRLPRAGLADDEHREVRQ